MPTLSYPGTPGTTLYAGLPTPPSATLVTTRTLSNTSGSTQASNFVSPMFGLPLKEGDMPSGEYPEFRLADDTPVPATVYNCAEWADGSMNMCGVIARVPSSVAGSGSLTMNVYSGGTAPAASSRTLAEVVAGSDIKIEYTGTTNLSGVWTASLNDAIANDGDITVIGDGPAGKVWRVGGHFKQSGSAHGQLYCWHYIAVLQNSAGGLLGVRYIGKFGQLFADVASPAPTHRIGTMVLKNGATTVRSLQGVIAMPSNSTDAGTVTSSVLVPHFSAGTTAGVDAEWDFFQCGGTATADCTIRVVQPTAYIQQSLLVPSFGVTPTVTVSDTPAADYYTNAKANHAEYQQLGPGEREEIGIMPAWAARYWVNPTAANQRAVMVNALCAFSYLAETRPAAEKKPAAVNVNGSTWTGVPSKPAWSLDQRIGGVINPAANTTVWSTDVAHRPAALYSAYLVSGRPEILDTLVGHACGYMQLTNTGYTIYKAARPLPGPLLTAFAGVRGMRIDDAGETYDLCGVLMKTGGIRQGAWAFRDIASAYAMVPNDYYDGDYKGYLGYAIDNSFRGFNAFCAANPAPWQADGMFVYSERQTAGGEGLFMMDYFDMAFCFISAVSQNARAIAARQYLGRRFPAISSRYNIGCMGCYDYQGWKDDGVAETYGDVVWNHNASTNSLVFDAATNLVTFGNSTAGANFNVTNGDVFCFVTTPTNTGTRPYAEFIDHKRFYVVERSGRTFKFAATPGGPALTIIRNFSFTNGAYYASFQDRTVGIEAGGTGGAQGYLAMSSSAANYHELLGDSVSAAAAELRAHLAYENPNFSTNPKYAIRHVLPA